MRRITQSAALRISWNPLTFRGRRSSATTMTTANAAKKFNVVYESYLKGTNTNIYFSVIPDKNYYLIENDVSTLTIAKIEDKFVAAVNGKSFDKLKSYVEGNDSKLASIISDFMSSLCAKIILGSIGGV